MISKNKNKNKRKNEERDLREIWISLVSSPEYKRRMSKNKNNASASLDNCSFAIRELPIESIIPDPNQPRRYFDKAKLKELAESIKQHGVLQPILVTPLENGRFEIVHGGRRFQASKIAGKTKIPAKIREISEQEKIEIQLIENLQREDLNPIEEAETFRRLIEKFGYTHEEIAKRMNKSREYISNKLRLLKLPKDLQKGIRRGHLSEGHGRALVSLNNHTLQRKIYTEINAQKLSVRDTEQYVRSLKKGIDVSHETPLTSPNTKTLLIPVYSEVFKTVKKTAKKMKMKPEELILKAVVFFLNNHGKQEG